jgi:hypothetical protein
MNIAKWVPSLIFLEFFFMMAYGQPDTLVLNPINNPALNEYNLRRMAVDKDNNIWIGTDKGIVKFDGNDLTVFDHSDKDTNTLTINSLGTIYFDKAVQELFVIGVGACIDALNIKTGKVSRLKISLREQDKSKRGFPFAFSCLHIDTDSTVWSGMFNIGFVHFDRRTNRTVYYTLPFKDESINQTVFDIQQDPDVPDILWLATYDGIYSFNKKTAAFSRKYHASDPKDSTSYDRTIICLDTRQRDTIWFTVPVYGFGYYDKKSGRYQIIRDIDKRTGKLTPHNIDRIQRRNPHEIWLSWDSGLPGLFNTATPHLFLRVSSQRKISNGTAKTLPGRQPW